MRKLKLQMRISIDGYVAGPNGEEDWDVKADEKLWQLIDELPDSSDTLLDQRQKLTLISATPYECGVTVLRYHVNKE